MSYKQANTKLRTGVSMMNTESSSFTQHIEIVNETDHAIFWLDHNNNPFSAKPNRRFHTDAMIKVYITYIFQRKDDVRYTLEMLDRINQIWLLRRKINGAFQNTTQISYNGATGDGKIVVKLCVDIEAKALQLQDHVYEEVSNLVFSFSNHFGVLHPGSVQARIEKQSDMGFTKDYLPHGLNFEIIDNDRGGSQRFIYMANTVVPIILRRDTVKPQGLYVYKVLGGDDHEKGRVMEYYSLTGEEGNGTYEEGCNLYGIFNTKDEASTNGNPEVMLNITLKDKEKELKQAKTENEEQKLRFTREIQQIERQASLDKIANDRQLQAEKTELERNKAEFDKQQAEEKAERESRLNKERDYYERKSAERKDTSEMIKFIPAVLMGFIGAALLFRR